MFALAGGLALLIVQLNFYFAWTSHVGAPVAGGLYLSGSPLRSFLVAEVNGFVNIQLAIPGLHSFLLGQAGAYEDSLYSSALRGSTGFLYLGTPGSLLMSYLIDAEVVLFTAAIFLIARALFRAGGTGVALLRALQVTSLAVLPLGLEIFMFDRPEFNLHASDLQVTTGLSWLTNADVLLTSASLLAVSAFLELAGRARRKGVEPARQATMAYPSS